MDEFFMRLALEEARKAYSIGEVPVGAVIVHNEKVISNGCNMKETLKDPTDHAEIIAIRGASKYLGGWRLSGCIMYVTLEPCPMCIGAILNSRIDRLVIGTRDPKMGACGTLIDLTNNEKFNHNVNVSCGVLEKECSDIIKKFFHELRK